VSTKIPEQRIDAPMKGKSDGNGDIAESKSDRKREERE